MNWNHCRLLTLHSLAKRSQPYWLPALSAASSANTSLRLKDPAASQIIWLGLETGAFLQFATDAQLLRWFRDPVLYPYCRSLLNVMQLPRPEAGGWSIQGAQPCLLLRVQIYPHSDTLQDHKTQEGQVLTSDFLMVLYSNSALTVKPLLAFIPPAVPAWGSVSIHACVNDAATCPSFSLPPMSWKGSRLLMTQLSPGFMEFDNFLPAPHKIIPRNCKCKPSPGDW